MGDEGENEAVWGSFGRRQKCSKIVMVDSEVCILEPLKRALQMGVFFSRQKYQMGRVTGKT